MVTSGSFTAEAIEFASGRNVTLVDGKKLFGLIQQAKVAWAGQGRVPEPLEPRPMTPFAATPSAELGSTCPVCASTMIRRVAKRGANAGQAFWGCTGYPS